MFKIYRIENREGKHGMWRNFDGSANPLLDTLIGDLPIKSLPMPDSEEYKQDGKQWFSAANTKEQLAYWFKKTDIEALLACGYEIFELQVTDLKILSEFEVIFTRESILSRKSLGIEDVLLAD